MPSVSYRDGLMEKLSKDPEYASLYLETSFEEALKDEYVAGFLLGLEDVVEAAQNRKGTASETDTLRQQLYHLLSKQETHTLETIISALKEVGLNYEMKPASAQVPSWRY